MNQKIKTGLGVIIIIILAITAGVFVQSQKGISGDKIIVYQNGTNYAIDNKAPYFKELQKEIEEFLTASDNALLEGVFNKTIQNIKKYRAVELVYSKPKELNIDNPYSPKIMIVRKLLVPLEGYYFPKTIFYDTDGNYSSGPFINSKGSELVSKIENLINGNSLDADTSNWQTYRNDTYGFEFKYPADWFMQQENNVQLENDRLILYLGNRPDVQFENNKISFNIQLVDNSNFVDYVKSGKPLSISEGTSYKNTILLIAEKEVVLQEFTFGSENTVRYEAVIPLGKNTLFIISSSEYKKILDQVLSTFKFTR